MLQFRESPRSETLKVAIPVKMAAVLLFEAAPLRVRRGVYVALLLRVATGACCNAARADRAVKYVPGD